MLKSQLTYLGYQTSIVRDGGLSIAGNPIVGGVLTASGAAAVQWQVAGVDVSGQTALTYTVQAGDVGKAITARSTSGAIETSNALTALAAVTAPTTTQPPLIVGTPTAGVPLTINAATFSGTAPTVERTIYGSAEPTSVILARGPAASTGYTPNDNDVTRTFIAVDVATNAAGMARSVSPRSRAAQPAAAPITGPLLRFASPYNRVATSNTTASTSARWVNNTCSRLPIGSGARKNLQVKRDNIVFNASGTGVGGPGNAVQYTDTWVVCNNVTRRVTFGGANSYTAADGELNILSDVLLPSQFNLTEFAVGLEVNVCTIDEVALGGKIPQREGSDTGRTEGISYDPSVTTVTGPSRFPATVTAGPAGVIANGANVALVGEFVDGLGDPRTFIFDGDSIFTNAARTAYEIVAASTAPFYAGCQVGRVGGQQAIVTQFPEIYKTTFLPYANTVLNEYGTNNVVEGLAKLQADSLAAWAFYRQNQFAHPNAKPLKILRSALLCRQDGNNGAVTAGWGAGGIAAQFNTWLQSQVGVGNGPDAYVDPATGAGGTIRDATDPYKWATTPTTMTNDGLHPNANGATVCAANYRPALDAIFAS